MIPHGADPEKIGSLRDRVIRFEESIGLRIDPAKIALAQHRAFLASQGIEWDDTPTEADDWRAEDREYM